MTLSYIEHFLVCTDDMEKTKDWYCRVLELEVGPHPDFPMPVYWLYSGDRDLVHISLSERHAGEAQRRYLGRTSQDRGAGTGGLDHIAFRCTGLKRTISRLRRLDVEFSQRQATAQAVYQLFLYDPNGIKIELNFNCSEAEGITAELTTADLPHDDPSTARRDEVK